MAREREIKFNAPPDMFQELHERLDYYLHEVKMETTYYDTPDGYFYRNKCSRRRRLEGKKMIYCCKTPVGPFERNEWECTGNFRNLANMCTHKDVADHIRGELVEVGSAHFTRYTGLMDWENCKVEISLDKGYLDSGHRKLPVCEVEVELKEGDWESCKRQALQMGFYYRLWNFNGASKAARVFSMYYGKFFEIPRQPV